MAIHKQEDLKAGDRFGRWKISGERITLHEASGTRAAYLCQCKCGTRRVVRAAQLIGGKSRSCGCLKRDLASRRRRKYGSEGGRLLNIWHGMKARCQKPAAASYAAYGGRGITVCKEWLDYRNFRAWALTNGYDDNLTIDRQDNDKGYSPDNCRWADDQSQARNRRSNRLLTAFGETKSCAEWLDDPRCEVDSRKTLWARLRTGMSDEDALTTPVQKRRI